MTATANAYEKNSIAGMTPLDLVIKVYDGAIAAYREASARFQAGDNEAGREQLERAKRFMVHLYTTLDEERGGEIAAQLGQLYTFVLNETNVLEATKDPKSFEDIVGIIDNLRQGWIELREQQSTAPSTNPAPKQDSFCTSA